MGKSVGCVAIVGPKDEGDAVGKKVGQWVLFDDLRLDLPVLAVTFPDFEPSTGE